MGDFRSNPTPPPPPEGESSLGWSPCGGCGPDGQPGEFIPDGQGGTYFYDPATGDTYYYNPATGEWSNFSDGDDNDSITPPDPEPGPSPDPFKPVVVPREKYDKWDNWWDENMPPEYPPFDFWFHPDDEEYEDPADIPAPSGWPPNVPWPPPDFPPGMDPANYNDMPPAGNGWYQFWDPNNEPFYYNPGPPPSYQYGEPYNVDPSVPPWEA